MSKPLSKFFQKRKSYSIDKLGKSETILCPDCDGTLLKNDAFIGCPCFGDIKNGVTLIKSEKSVKVQFSDEWDAENISLFLEVLRSKNKDLD